MTTIAKKLAQIKPGTLLAGVDLGLDSMAVVMLDNNGQRVDRFLASQSREGYDYFHERLLRVVRKQGACGVLVGMEPTNLSDARQATTGNKWGPSSPKSSFRFAWSIPSP